MRTKLGRRPALLGLTAALAVSGGAPAWADDQFNAGDRFAVWLPDSWDVERSRHTISAASSSGNLHAVCGAVDDAKATVGDSDVLRFIGAVLDAVQVGLDRETMRGEHTVRIITGIARADGEQVSFRALASEPLASGAVVVAVVYGPSRTADDATVTEIFDRILRSFRPI